MEYWENQMSFKDVLLALITYPEATPVSTIDDAIAIAGALRAKISAIACEVKIKAACQLALWCFPRRSSNRFG
jgi:hypothetical protein